MTQGRASLRPHHLICLQFFRGEGYDTRFIDNLTEVIGRARDAGVIVVSGADDVCGACPGLGSDQRCTDPHAGEAEVTRIDALASELLALAPGDVTSLALVAEMLSEDAVAVGRWRYEACDGCTWEEVCDAGWKGLMR